MVDFDKLQAIVMRVSLERERVFGLTRMILDMISEVDTSRHAPMIALWDFKAPSFLYVNCLFAETIGRTRDEAIATPFTEMITPENLAASMAEYEKNKSTEGETKIHNFYSPYLHVDGSNVDLWWDGLNRPDIGFGGGLIYNYNRAED